MQLEGRCWVFGDHINTDLMYPHESFQATPQRRRHLCLSFVRPGWSAEVRPGDLLVAGWNFGTGSGRPAAQVLKDMGVGGIIARSVGGLFYRGAVNSAVPIMECPEVTGIVREGQRLAADFATGEVVNVDTGARAEGQPMPAELLEIVRSGGVLERLMKGGYLEPDQPAVRAGGPGEQDPEVE